MKRYMISSVLFISGAAILLLLWQLLQLFQLEIQRFILKFLIYFILSYTMHLFYAGTTLLHLGQVVFFAFGSYNVIIANNNLWQWGLSLVIFSSAVILIFYLLKEMDQMSFAISSLCLMGIFEEVVRLLIGITGGTDGIYGGHRNGTSLAMIMVLGVVWGLLLYHYFLLKTGFVYKSELAWSGKAFMEAYGLSVVRFRLSLFLPSVFFCYLAGIAYGVSEQYVTPSMTLQPSLTLIPLSTTLLARGIFTIFPLLLILLGLQEILGYVLLGYEATFGGIVLMLLAYILLIRKEHPA